MARLSLQLGAALVVSFAAQLSSTSGDRNWRIRRLRAPATAMVGSDAWGSTAHDRLLPPVWFPTPARLRASARTAGE